MSGLKAALGLSITIYFGAFFSAVAEPALSLNENSTQSSRIRATRMVDSPHRSHLVIFMGGLAEICAVYRGDMEWAAQQGLSSLCFIQRTEDPDFGGDEEELLEDLDGVIRNARAEGWQSIHIVSHSMSFLTVEAWLRSYPDAGNLVDSVSYTNPMPNGGSFLPSDQHSEYMNRYFSEGPSGDAVVTYRYGNIQKYREVKLRMRLALFKAILLLSNRLNEARLQERASVPTHFFITDTDPNADHEAVREYIERLNSHGYEVYRHPLEPKEKDHHNPNRNGDHSRSYLLPSLSFVMGLNTPERDMREFVRRSEGRCATLIQNLLLRGAHLPLSHSFE